MRRQKKIFHATGNDKKAGVAIVKSDKIHFKTKSIKKDKEGHDIMIKGSIQEEDITIVNIHAPSIGAPQYIRQMLTAIKGEIYRNTIRVGDFNTPLTSVDRPSRQKVNEETQALNYTLYQMYLIDIYRTLHPKEAEYTFFSSTHRTCFRIDHTVGHKESLNNLRKLKTYQASFLTTTL